MNMENHLYQAAARRQMAAHHAAQASNPPFYAPQTPPPSPFYAPQAPGSHAFYGEQAQPQPPMPLAVANVRPNNWTPQSITSTVNRQEELIETLMKKQDEMVEKQDKMFEVMTQQMLVCVAKQNQHMEENAKNMQEMLKILMGALTNNAISPAPTSEPTPVSAQAPAPVAPITVAKAKRSAPYRKRQPERKLMEVNGCTFGEASEYNEGKKNYRKYSCAKCERTYLSWSGLKGHFQSKHQ